MRVLDLKKILKEYSDFADVQINICDGYNTEEAESFFFDDEYNKIESCVIHVNIKKEEQNG